MIAWITAAKPVFIRESVLRPFDGTCAGRGVVERNRSCSLLLWLVVEPTRNLTYCLRCLLRIERVMIGRSR